MQSSHGVRVAATVRAEMARRRISQAELAARTGRGTQAYWSRRTTGLVPFDIDDLAAVAAVLDVPVATLLAEAVA